MNKNPRKYEWYSDPQGSVIIYVNMEKKISVGITGTFKPRIFDRVDFIEKKVLPVIDG